MRSELEADEMEYIHADNEQLVVKVAKRRFEKKIICVEIICIWNKLANR
jgi:hypothetical protein